MQQRRSHTHEHQRNNNGDTKIYVVQVRTDLNPQIVAIVFTISQSMIQGKKHTRTISPKLDPKLQA